ncbi:Uu.00g053930.m01.CDS01 [Anthostomella pinea]|uniref:Uu.00g053930.m01.CDS01 n=1 Tax=Anthostomella pinea TaxID=933095 RepID=A0AAI8YPJ2_9PEZI|nr:Uu.00g053930.m01.CDS01 [Anthostomella pinea]
MSGIEKLGSCGGRRRSSLIEDNIGDVAVESDVQGVQLVAIVVDSITDGDAELARGRRIFFILRSIREDCETIVIGAVKRFQSSAG